MIFDEFSLDNPKNQGNGKWGRLSLLPRNDPNYLFVCNQFRKGWKHPKKPRPKVWAVFKILSSEASLKPFHEYRAMVASSPAMQGISQNPANEQLLFHGTNRRCLLGEDSTRVRLCPLAECFLCSVVRGSYDIEKCGVKNKFRRFGTGIYTTACSSKADDYAVNVDPSARLRVLLVNRVIVGNPFKKRYNAVSITEPPCGYHSVHGEPGGDLNYEETVVYTNDAIRPAYLVVYGDAAELPSKIQLLLKTLFKTPVAS
ncbi:hypothetical protein BDQ17DRAFT_1281419 [Cyathus striatus]|nr:hypothetical protein BDQ17DRAFT_1281419 [Cyathus striatus]